MPSVDYVFCCCYVAASRQLIRSTFYSFRIFIYLFGIIFSFHQDLPRSGMVVFHLRPKDRDWFIWLTLLVQEVPKIYSPIC